MSYKIYFGFTAGLNTTMRVPKGTIERLHHHIEEVEETLNIKREKYLDNPEHWSWTDYKEIDDKVLCETAERHNKIVRDFYEDLGEWSVDPPVDFEELTKETFAELLPGLSTITVKPERWTGEYYTERMQCLFNVMTGYETEGITFDQKKLTIKQAGAVIRLFSQFLDNHDRQLDVPKGKDYLASSYDGGYWWCEKCGAITYDDAGDCSKKKCPYLLKGSDDEQL